tara:strand:+ start:1279 stop:2283 length:1005 start_codon:yes stop_codon:yes gene_type:complete
MEDHNSNLLNDSKNEWCIRLMNVLSSHIIDGFRSIFNESITLCETNEEPEKYLMTFQNLLSRIPKWNQTIIEKECNRIKECSKCVYLNDLITCVHVVQLKILSCVRTSNDVKKIDIDIPQFDRFLHNVYINIARKLYSNIYLFQVDISPLEQQKNNREFENIVQASIMNTIRDNIPIDLLLKQYMDETQVEDVEQKIISKEPIEEKETQNIDSSNSTTTNEKETEVPSNDNISFSENVKTLDPLTNEIENEKINFESKPEPASLYDDEEDDEEILKIGESIQLNLGESLDPKPEKIENEEITPIDLNELSVKEETNEAPPKNDVIDLNIEEIRL